MEKTESKLKCRFMVYYNNGHCEFVDKINIHYTHLVGIGVARIVVDLDDARAFIPDGEGGFKEVTVTQVSGLL